MSVYFEEGVDSPPDVPTGMVTIAGRVVSTKIVHGNYGMLVRDERGFSVFGDVPAGLRDVKRDDLVRFTAFVTRNKKDPNFGIFKWASKATYIDTDRPDYKI